MCTGSNLQLRLKSDCPVYRRVVKSLYMCLPGGSTSEMQLGAPKVYSSNNCQNKLQNFGSYPTAYNSLRSIYSRKNSWVSERQTLWHWTCPILTSFSPAPHQLRKLAAWQPLEGTKCIWGSWNTDRGLSQCAPSGRSLERPIHGLSLSDLTQSSPRKTSTYQGICWKELVVTV